MGSGRWVILENLSSIEKSKEGGKSGFFFLETWKARGNRLEQEVPGWSGNCAFFVTLLGDWEGGSQPGASYSCGFLAYIGVL